jgi:hypothetical protein
MAQLRSPPTKAIHYWIFFIDDFKAIYLLKCKSETFAVFKNFKAWAENVTGQRMGSMLYESGMPLSFFGEAMSFFIHVSNRVTTTSLPGATPHEAFYKDKPDLSHLCVWGCTAYVLSRGTSGHLGALEHTFFMHQRHSTPQLPPTCYCI